MLLGVEFGLEVEAGPRPDEEAQPGESEWGKVAHNLSRLRRLTTDARRSTALDGAPGEGGRMYQAAPSRLLSGVSTFPPWRARWPPYRNLKPNRVVTALTPLVFAPLAGAISVFAAANVPGLDIDTGQLQAVFIAGATIAFGKAALWLKGWQDFEQRDDAVATTDS